jgi:uncharacterized membrane protein YphA (DoxX/SURF4 family)
MIPSLLAYQAVGPFLIRILTGVTLAWFGYQKTIGKGRSSGSNSKIYGMTEIFLSLFLIAGFFTQIAALMNMVILIIKIGYKAQDKKLLTDGINYYILLIVMVISLIFTGPGILALDSLFQ